MLSPQQQKYYSLKLTVKNQLSKKKPIFSQEFFQLPNKTLMFFQNFIETLSILICLPCDLTLERMRNFTYCCSIGLVKSKPDREAIIFLQEFWIRNDLYAFNLPYDKIVHKTLKVDCMWWLIVNELGCTLLLNILVQKIHYSQYGMYHTCTRVCVHPSLCASYIVISWNTAALRNPHVVQHVRLILTYLMCGAAAQR